MKFASLEPFVVKLEFISTSVQVNDFQKILSHFIKKLEHKFYMTICHSSLLRTFVFFCDLFLKFIRLACAVFEAIEVKGQLMLNFEAVTSKFCNHF